jgi:hypothetical protein
MLHTSSQTLRLRTARAAHTHSRTRTVHKWHLAELRCTDMPLHGHKIVPVAIHHAIPATNGKVNSAPPGAGLAKCVISYFPFRRSLHCRLAQGPLAPEMGLEFDHSMRVRHGAPLAGYCTRWRAKAARNHARGAHTFSNANRLTKRNSRNVVAHAPATTTTSPLRPDPAPHLIRSCTSAGSALYNHGSTFPQILALAISTFRERCHSQPNRGALSPDIGRALDNSMRIHLL